MSTDGRRASQLPWTSFIKTLSHSWFNHLPRVPPSNAILLMHLSALHYCNKISDTMNLKKNKGLFWLIVLEVSIHGQLAPLQINVTRQHITVVACDRVSCSSHHSQEARRVTGGGKGPNIPFKGMPPMAHLLPVGPTSYRFQHGNFGGQKCSGSHLEDISSPSSHYLLCSWASHLALLDLRIVLGANAPSKLPNLTWPLVKWFCDCKPSQHTPV
jgi:hypothetical protein